MKNKTKTPSVYLRTVLSLALCTIIVFLVLCILYYQQMSTSLIVDAKSEMTDRAASITDAYDALLEDENATLSSITSYLSSMARVEECTIWLVDQDSKLVYLSDIPESKKAYLVSVGDNLYLSEEMHTDMLMQIGKTNTDESRDGLFTDSRSVWVSTVTKTDNGRYLQFYTEFNVQAEAFWRLSNALALPVLISFSMALVLFTLMTRSIIRPLRLLSDAASKVTQGDLSARIVMPELEKESPVKYVLTDEISLMVRTVNSMIERLERQESDRKLFISSIAHDLRTPLTSIKGFLTAMTDGTIPPEKYPMYMDTIVTEVNRIQKLITSMTEASSLSQIDRNKLEFFDINEMIRDTVSNLENLLAEKNLDVQVDLNFNQDNEMLVYGDSQALYRVIYNLITNAVKFTPIDGIIGLSTTYQPKTDTVIVSVEDSGTGIPPEKESRVFESFYKVDPSRAESGFGLGLYICREIIYAHGQKIWVERSQDLGGAKFVYTLHGCKPEEQA